MKKAPVYTDFIESIFVPSKQNWVWYSCKKMTFDHFLAFLCTFDKPQMQYAQSSWVDQYK